MTGVDQAEKNVKYDQYWRKDVAYKFIDLTQGKFIDGCRDRYGNVSIVCWSLTSLCHSNGHIETMPAREINPFTALTRIRSQFLRTQ